MTQQNEASWKQAPMYKAWRRLRKNKPAVISLFIILVAVLLAIFAPLIAPDKTPDANDQVLELANKNPGYSTQVLLVTKNRQIPTTSFLQRLAKGTENPNQIIPIQSYRIEGFNMVVEQYKGDHMPPIEKVIPLEDVLYSLSVENPHIQYQGKQATFKLSDGQLITASADEMAEASVRKHITTKKILPRNRQLLAAIFSAGCYSV